jgi:hypothetical protein
MQSVGRFVPPDVLQIIADQIRKISDSNRGGILTLGSRADCVEETGDGQKGQQRREQREQEVIGLLGGKIEVVVGAKPLHVCLMISLQLSGTLRRASIVFAPFRSKRAAIPEASSLEAL